MFKNKRVQNTSYKVQGSIRNTPEGTDTERSRLIGGAGVTIDELHVPSVKSIELCTSPVASGGE